MSNTTTLAALAGSMALLGQTARALDTDNHSNRGPATAELAATFDVVKRAFDARVAAMTEEERWQFMFTAMLSGVLEDE